MPRPPRGCAGYCRRLVSRSPHGLFVTAVVPLHLSGQAERCARSRDPCVCLIINVSFGSLDNVVMSAHSVVILYTCGADASTSRYIGPSTGVAILASDTEPGSKSKSNSRPTSQLTNASRRDHEV